MKLWIINYNYDYEETMEVHRSLEAAEASIRESFGIEDGLSGDALFRALREAYENGKWKGFHFKVYDTETGTLRDAEALLYKEAQEQS